MTWVKQQEKNHLCEFPSFVDKTPAYGYKGYTMEFKCSLGDVWQCDECDRYWVVCMDKDRVYFQEHVVYHERVSVIPNTDIEDVTQTITLVPLPSPDGIRLSRE